MISKQKRSLIRFTLERLHQTFPDARIELDYHQGDPWQLLVAVVLSAQTTDKKVNDISPALFERFASVYRFAEAEPQQIEPYLKTLGLYRTKAKNLNLAAQKIVRDFNGQVPDNRKDLESLPGVGSKSSAVIVSNEFGTPAIAVDTHVARVSKRLGLTEHTDPNKIEAELTALMAKEELLFAHHALIFHGRRICLAKKPKCSACPLSRKCPRIGVLLSQ